MKSIFKTILLAGFVGFFAHTASAQIKLGIKVGANSANINYSEDGGFDYKSIVGLQAGVILEMPITEVVGLRSGVELQTKGSQLEESDEFGSFEGKLNPVYAQIPAVLAYNGSMFFVGAGPYIGFGLAGKSKSKTTENLSGITIEDNHSLDFGSSNGDDISPLDYGARFEAGVKLNKIRIGLNYDLGLANIIPKDVREGESAKHGVLGLWVGYIF